jgi:hypothetical protein
LNSSNDFDNIDQLLLPFENYGLKALLIILISFGKTLGKKI